MQPQRKTATQPKPPSFSSWLAVNPIPAIGVGVVAVVILVWALWPSPYAHVANLGSRGTNIVAFGDSLTAGYGAPAGEDYPSDLSRLIGRPIINAGVSGDTTETALERIDSDVLSRDPRIVIVGLGGNDFLRSIPISETEANLRTIVSRLTGRGTIVVLLAFRFPSLTADYESMYERIAKENRSLVVKGVLAKIETDPSFKSDEIHPNSRGYQLMADRVSQPLRKLIAKADAAR